ncbi:MAG TPA: DEAD/DEAH box helicase [Longimicrobiales bacterium]
MDYFRPATRRWFEAAFAGPTEVQRRGWERIAAGDHTLLIAPTGSGKTLAAFLYALDRLHHPSGAARGSLEAGSRKLEARAERSLEARSSKPEAGVLRGSGVKVVYVSPLKALVYDIERNLRVPLAGIGRSAQAAGEEFVAPRVDVRTGDTPQDQRRRFLRDPGEILVTTPESLFLLLGSQAREQLRTVEWIIVDEIHAMAATKRGAHLALSLERLSALADKDPQRIGLSATARPAEEVARFLGGDRPVSIVDAHVPPALDLQVVVPVEDMTRPVVETEEGDFLELAPDAPPSGPLMLADAEETTRQFGIWPAVYPKILDLVRSHRSTIVFVNSRGLCERLAQRLNEQAGEELVRAHHGSLAHEQRKQIEEGLKAGTLRGIVATSSLELGIDMGAVDLVVLVESPGSVASGLQRVGRAGHGVGETSIGRVFPKHRGDLLEAAIVAKRMRDGEIESLRVPRNPLDVLAQHVVAMCGVQDWRVPDLAKVIRRAANYRELPDSALTGVLDMLSGLYPSNEFADLRPRIRWDRERDVVEGRKGARMLAAVNAGTIPDRGLYGVFLGEDGPRVGELDEEMVHESLPGQTFTLGASTWRIVDINRNRVTVEPAPGEPGRLPFWKGEGPGRPLELGRALGAFTREVGFAKEADAQRRLETVYGLDEKAARNLVAYLTEQRETTGTLPTDRDITIERFRDELGDWRVCILTPFGARVHAPWALALRATMSERLGYEVQTVWSDDGIVLNIADGDEVPDAEMLIPHADDIEERVLEELPGSPLFASQFRENAARALLLPRRRPGQRTPLYAQRLRANKLMSIALEYPSFPIVIETMRSTLQDVFDVPALRDVLRQIESGEVRVHEVETLMASPFARSLVFAYVAEYLYEGDSPAAERRAQALSVDIKLLRELLGEADLRELLDVDVIAQVEAELQRTAEGRRARDADELSDVLRFVGDLSLAEAEERVAGSLPGGGGGGGTGAGDGEPRAAEELLRALERERRAARVRVGGRDAWIAVEDAGLYRDALGVAPPSGIASVFLEEVEEPVHALIGRFARTHGPFTTRDVAQRFGIVHAQAHVILEQLASEEKLLRGEFRPGGQGEEWCDPEVLRQIKRRTIAKLRGQVAPVAREVLARFLPSWHRISGDAPHERLEEAIVQLEGMPLSYRELTRLILPARVRGFRPEMLDEMGALGWLVWVGHSPVRSDDGRIQLFRRERVDRLLIPQDIDSAQASIESFDERHQLIVEHLERRGASFHAELVALLREKGHPAESVLEAVWDLVWAGIVTNDTFASLRFLGSSTVRRARPSRPRRGREGLEAGNGGAPRARRMAPGWWRDPAARTATASGPGGRWSLVRDLVRAPVSSTERAAAWATTLLDRHGIVARETAAVEALGGGFGSVYRVLRSMEEAGKLRRGYFVEGLGGAQFTYPGVVDRLRRVRDAEVREQDVVALAATDPANPYGWLLPWPELTEAEGHGPRRSTGAAVVLVDGEPVLYLDRNGRRLRTFADASAQEIDRALPALRTIARARPRGLVLDRIGNESAIRSELAPRLREAGFTQDYKYLRLTS